jgi:hypothetical protein
MSSSSKNFRPRVFFGHHKVATSWMLKIMSDLGHLNGFRIEVVNTAAEIDAALLERLATGKSKVLICRNADPVVLGQLRDFVGFHLIRDPRDMLVSSYFSHLHSHPTHSWPELIEHRNKLQKLDLDQGLLLDMAFCKSLPTQGHDVRPFDCMREWDYQRDNILETTYEEMVVNNYEYMLNVFRFLGILGNEALGMKSLSGHLLRILGAHALPKKSKSVPAIPTWNLLAAVCENSFLKKSAGRSRGMEDQTSHYRKGVAGDWKNYFKPEHKSRFVELYGDLLQYLGYEKDKNW